MAILRALCREVRDSAESVEGVPNTALRKFLREVDEEGGEVRFERNFLALLKRRELEDKLLEEYLASFALPPDAREDLRSALAEASRLRLAGGGAGAGGYGVKFLAALGEVVRTRVDEGQDSLEEVQRDVAQLAPGPVAEALFLRRAEARWFHYRFLEEFLRHERFDLGATETAMLRDEVMGILQEAEEEDADPKRPRGALLRRALALVAPAGGGQGLFGRGKAAAALAAAADPKAQAKRRALEILGREPEGGGGEDESDWSATGPGADRRCALALFVALTDRGRRRALGKAFHLRALDQEMGLLVQPGYEERLPSRAPRWYQLLALTKQRRTYSTIFEYLAKHRDYAVMPGVYEEKEEEGPARRRSSQLVGSAELETERLQRHARRFGEAGLVAEDERAFDEAARLRVLDGWLQGGVDETERGNLTVPTVLELAEMMNATWRTGTGRVTATGRKVMGVVAAGTFDWRNLRLALLLYARSWGRRVRTYLATGSETGYAQLTTDARARRASLGGDFAGDGDATPGGALSSKFGGSLLARFRRGGGAPGASGSASVGSVLTMKAITDSLNMFRVRQMIVEMQLLHGVPTSERAYAQCLRDGLFRDTRALDVSEADTLPDHALRTELQRMLTLYVAQLNREEATYVVPHFEAVRRAELRAAVVAAGRGLHAAAQVLVYALSAVPGALLLGLSYCLCWRWVPALLDGLGPAWTVRAQLQLVRRQVRDRRCRVARPPPAADPARAEGVGGEGPHADPLLAGDAEDLAHLVNFEDQILEEAAGAEDLEAAQVTPLAPEEMARQQAEFIRRQQVEVFAWLRRKGFSTFVRRQERRTKNQKELKEEDALANQTWYAACRFHIRLKDGHPIWPDPNEGDTGVPSWELAEREDAAATGGQDGDEEGEGGGDGGGGGGGPRASMVSSVAGGGGGLEEMEDDPLTLEEEEELALKKSLTRNYLEEVVHQVRSAGGGSGGGGPAAAAAAVEAAEAAVLREMDHQAVEPCVDTRVLVDFRFDQLPAADHAARPRPLDQVPLRRLVCATITFQDGRVCHLWKRAIDDEDFMLRALDLAEKPEHPRTRQEGYLAAWRFQLGFYYLRLLLAAVVYFALWVCAVAAYLFLRGLRLAVSSESISASLKTKLLLKGRKAVRNPHLKRFVGDLQNRRGDPPAVWLRNLLFRWVFPFGFAYEGVRTEPEPRRLYQEMLRKWYCPHRQKSYIKTEALGGIISGYFQVKYNGGLTNFLPASCPPETLREELEHLCPLDKIDEATFTIVKKRKKLKEPAGDDAGDADPDGGGASPGLEVDSRSPSPMPGGADSPAPGGKKRKKKNPNPITRQQALNLETLPLARATEEGAVDVNDRILLREKEAVLGEFRYRPESRELEPVEVYERNERRDSETGEVAEAAEPVAGAFDVLKVKERFEGIGYYPEATRPTYFGKGCHIRLLGVVYQVERLVYEDERDNEAEDDELVQNRTYRSAEDKAADVPVGKVLVKKIMLYHPCQAKKKGFFGRLRNKHPSATVTFANIKDQMVVYMAAPGEDPVVTTPAPGGGRRRSLEARAQPSSPHPERRADRRLSSVDGRERRAAKFFLVAGSDEVLCSADRDFVEEHLMTELDPATGDPRRVGLRLNATAANTLRPMVTLRVGEHVEFRRGRALGGRGAGPTGGGGEEDEHVDDRGRDTVDRRGVIVDSEVRQLRLSLTWRIPAAGGGGGGDAAALAFKPHNEEFEFGDCLQTDYKFRGNEAVKYRTEPRGPLLNGIFHQEALEAETVHLWPAELSIEERRKPLAVARALVHRTGYRRHQRGRFAVWRPAGAEGAGAGRWEDVGEAKVEALQEEHWYRVEDLAHGRHYQVLREDIYQTTHLSVKEKNKLLDVLNKEMAELDRKAAELRSDQQGLSPDEGAYKEIAERLGELAAERSNLSASRQDVAGYRTKLRLATPYEGPSDSKGVGFRVVRGNLPWHQEHDVLRVEAKREKKRKGKDGGGGGGPAAEGGGGEGKRRRSMLGKKEKDPGPLARLRTAERLALPAWEEPRGSRQELLNRGDAAGDPEAAADLRNLKEAEDAFAARNVRFEVFRVREAVEVTQSGADPQGGYTWQVTQLARAMWGDARLGAPKVLAAGLRGQGHSAGVEVRGRQYAREAQEKALMEKAARYAKARQREAVMSRDGRAPPIWRTILGSPGTMKFGLWLLVLRPVVLWTWAALAGAAAAAAGALVVVLKFLNIVLLGASKGQKASQKESSLVARILSHDVFDKNWRKGKGNAVLQETAEAAAGGGDRAAGGGGSEAAGARAGDRGRRRSSGVARNAMEAKASEKSKGGRSWFYEEPLQQSLGVYMSRTPNIAHNINYYRSLAAQVDDAFITQSNQLTSPAVPVFHQYLDNLPLRLSRAERRTHLFAARPGEMKREYDLLLQKCQSNSWDMKKVKISAKTQANTLHSSMIPKVTATDKQELGIVRKGIVDYLPEFLESEEYNGCKDLEVFGGSFDPSKVADKYINGFIMLLSFFHLKLAGYVAEIFDCSETSLRTTLDANAEMTCWTSEGHQTLIFWGVVFGVLFAGGIPALFLYVLYFKVERPNHRHKRQEKARYGYMYQKYSYGAWFWEVILMSRKSFVKLWTMFTSNDKELLQASGAFFFFLFMWFYHTLTEPYIERDLNKLDAAALTGHVFVMYAGSMFLTGKLDTALTTIYAAFVILGNLAIFVYILQFVVKEVTESLPMMGQILSPEFWLEVVIPLIVAHAKYLVLGAGHKAEFLDRYQLFWDYLAGSNEDTKREELATRAARTNLLGEEGAYWAKNWLREPGTSMREGEYYVRWLEAYMHCVDRSTFDQMIQHQWKTSELGPEEQNFWCAAVAKALRVAAAHAPRAGGPAAGGGGGGSGSAVAARGRSLLVQGDGPGAALRGFAYYQGKYVSVGTADLMRQAQLPATLVYVMRHPLREWGVYYRARRLTVEIDGTIIAHLDASPGEGAEGGGGGGGGGAAAAVAVVVKDPLHLRLYTEVEVRDARGQWWNATIYKVDTVRGDYYLEDAAGVRALAPVGRAALRRARRAAHPLMDLPAGYLWRLHCSQEDRLERIPLSREDRDLRVNINDVYHPKGQIEWFQSRCVTAAVQIGGSGDATWVAVGYADGSVDLWSADPVEKVRTLQHERPVRHVYISPDGGTVISFSDRDAVVWSIPEDKENRANRVHLSADRARQSTFLPTPALSDAHAAPPESFYPFSAEMLGLGAGEGALGGLVEAAAHTPWADREIMAVACNNELNQANVSVLVRHRGPGRAKQLELYLLNPAADLGPPACAVGEQHLDAAQPQRRVESCRWVDAPDAQGSPVPTRLLVADKLRVYLFEVAAGEVEGTPHERLRCAVYWDTFPAAAFGAAPRVFMADDRVVFQGRAIVRAQQPSEAAAAAGAGGAAGGAAAKGGEGGGGAGAEEFPTYFRAGDKVEGPLGEGGAGAAAWRLGVVEGVDYRERRYLIKAVLPPATEGESGRIARRLENGDGVEQHQLDIAQENVLRKRYDIGDDIEVRIVNDWINGTIQKVYLREKGALKSNKLTYYDVLVDPYIKAVSRYQLKKIYKKKDLLLIRDPSNGEQKEGFVVDVNEDTETYTIKYRADAVDGKGGSREEELALKFSSDQYSHRDHEVFSVGEEVRAVFGPDDADRGRVAEAWSEGGVGRYRVEFAYQPERRLVRRKGHMTLRLRGQSDAGFASLAMQYSEQLGTYPIRNFKKAERHVDEQIEALANPALLKVLQLHRPYPWTDGAVLQALAQLVAVQLSPRERQALREDWGSFAALSATEWFKEAVQWLKACLAADASTRNTLGISDRTYELLRSKLVAARNRARVAAARRAAARRRYVEGALAAARRRLAHEAWLEAQAEALLYPRLLVQLPQRAAQAAHSQHNQATSMKTTLNQDDDPVNGGGAGEHKGAEEEKKPEA